MGKADKKIVAATNIEHDGEKTKVGDVIDPKKFTKEQLTRLHDKGAIKVVAAHEVEEKEEPKLTDITDTLDDDFDKKSDKDSDEKSDEDSKHETGTTGESKVTVTPPTTTPPPPPPPVKKTVPGAAEKK